MSEASGSKVREEYERRTRRNQAEAFAVQRSSLSGSTLVNPPGDAPRINTPDGALGPRVHEEPGFDVPKSDMVRCRPRPHQAEPGKPIERRLGIKHELGNPTGGCRRDPITRSPENPSSRGPASSMSSENQTGTGRKKHEPESPSSRARHRDSEFGIPCGTCDELAPRYAMIGGVREKTGDDPSDIRKPDGPCAPKRKSTEMPSMEKDPPRIARAQTVPRSKWPEMRSLSQGRTQGLDIRVKVRAEVPERSASKNRAGAD
ncbi:hypothetical protein DFH06DRAFT_337829 [Mycena polygramma]|nr:hypothetical protein DFH06DRAFT_337829 [Mycena polygramma]